MSPNASLRSRRPSLSRSILAALIGIIAIGSPVGARAKLPPARSSTGASAPANQTPAHKPEQPKPKSEAISSGAKSDKERLDELIQRLTYSTLVAALSTLVVATPIGYYIIFVWTSRRQAIFGCLSPAGKEMYLRRYQAAYPDVAVLVAADGSANAATASQFETAFDKVFKRWFGRSQLAFPAALFLAIFFAFSYAIAGAALKEFNVTVLRDYSLTLKEPAIAALAGALITTAAQAIFQVGRRDLLPNDLNGLSLRLTAAVPIGVIVAAIVKDKEWSGLVALVIAGLPVGQVQLMLRSLAMKQLSIPDTSLTQVDQVMRLSGIDSKIAERLDLIGVSTIGQLAYSDPVMLTMRTSFGFVYVIDIVSQALAWIYLGDNLDKIRPIGLRGSFEISTLKRDAAGDGDKAMVEPSLAVIAQLADLLKMSAEQVDNVIHQIADDPYTEFLHIGYCPSCKPISA